MYVCIYNIYLYISCVFVVDKIDRTAYVALCAYLRFMALYIMERTALDNDEKLDT